MIFVSTGGLPDQPAWKSAEWFSQCGIGAVELSGGIPDSAQLKKLKELRSRVNFQIHNYFPPPDIPFVFNLASLDHNVGKKSLHHVETAMRWALELDRPVYSFHAGFLLDPQVAELGQVSKKKNLYDRAEAMQLFLERVNLLGDRAAELGVELLIENNVLSKKNFLEFDGAPFLLLEAEECIDVMRQTPDNVNLLIDVAHLKVSANSLCFDPVEFMRSCDSWIQGYHFSDNDGLHDANKVVGKGAWFWPYIKKGLDYYSLEVYDVAPAVLSEQYELVSQQLSFSDATD